MRNIWVFLFVLILLSSCWKTSLKENWINVKNEAQVLCDPSDSNVTKNLNFSEVYNPKIVPTAIWDFIELEKWGGVMNTTGWVWEVCWLPVVFIRDYKNQESKIFYNNKMYAVDSDIIPKYDITSSIAFYNNSNEKDDSADDIFGKKNINGDIYEIKKIASDETTGYPQTSLYKNGEKVSGDYKYVGVENSWDHSFDVLDWKPVFIVADGPALSWEWSWPVPSYDTEVQYQVIVWDTPFSEKYDYIRGLKIIDNKIGFDVGKYIENEDWELEIKVHVHYDGKNYWENMALASTLIDTWDGIWYLWQTDNEEIKIFKGENELYTVIGNFRYNNSINSSWLGFWDLDFIWGNMILNTICENGEWCIIYWDKKITEFSWWLRNFSWKLVVITNDNKIIIQK